MSVSRIAAVLGLACVLVAPPVSAQDDFRHVDESRPLRVEDAYPIKFQEWEWEIGTGARAAEGGAYELTSVLELKTGVARNLQLGFEIHSATAREAGSTQTGYSSRSMTSPFSGITSPAN